MSINKHFADMDTPIVCGDASTDTKASGVVSGNTATLALPEANLVCVEYPGVVNNVDRMLESIGLEKGVSKVITHLPMR